MNDGAPVGEECECVGWTVEAKEEIVKTDLAVGGETVAHGGEVDGALMLVNLDRVSAAEGDVWAAFAGEMREDALGADCAGGVGLRGVDFATLVGPEIEGEERSADEVGLAGKELEGFGDLDGGDEIYCGG